MNSPSKKNDKNTKHYSPTKYRTIKTKHSDDEDEDEFTNVRRTRSNSHKHVKTEIGKEDDADSQTQIDVCKTELKLKTEAVKPNKELLKTEMDRMESDEEKLEQIIVDKYSHTNEGIDHLRNIFAGMTPADVEELETLQHELTELNEMQCTDSDEEPVASAELKYEEVKPEQNEYIKVETVSDDEEELALIQSTIDDEIEEELTNSAMDDENASETLNENASNGNTNDLEGIFPDMSPVGIAELRCLQDELNELEAENF